MIDLNKVLNSSKMWIFTESPNIISPWTKTTPDVWNELLFAKTGAVVRCMSCSLPVAAKYRHLMFTLHLSHLTHWTRADFGSAAVVWCISKTMPSCHSFGSPQIADNSENKSILEKKKIVSRIGQNPNHICVPNKKKRPEIGFSTFYCGTKHNKKTSVLSECQNICSLRWYQTLGELTYQIVLWTKKKQKDYMCEKHLLHNSRPKRNLGKHTEPNLEILSGVKSANILQCQHTQAPLSDKGASKVYEQCPREQLVWSHATAVTR